MHLHTVSRRRRLDAERTGYCRSTSSRLPMPARSPITTMTVPGLRPAEQKTLVRDLGDKRMMLLRNHGTLTWGRSIAEAFTLMHYLERTCEIQIAAQAGGPPVLPRKSVIERTAAIGQGTGNVEWARNRLRGAAAPARPGGRLLPSVMIRRSRQPACVRRLRVARPRAQGARWRRKAAGRCRGLSRARQGRPPSGATAGPPADGHAIVLSWLPY